MSSRGLSFSTDPTGGGGGSRDLFLGAGCGFPVKSKVRRDCLC